MQNSPFMGEAILRHIGSMYKEPGDVFDKALHRHPEYLEFMLVAEGTVQIQIDTKWYHADPHSLVVYNPGIWHKETSDLDEHNHFLFFGLNGFQIPGLPNGWLTENQQQYVLPLKEHYSGLEKRFIEIKYQKNKNTFHSQWIANSLAATFLIEVLAVLAPPQKLKNRRRGSRDITSVKQYIHEHYFEPISLHDLAKTAFMSPFHLSHLFKAEAGISPMNYLISYRMEVAKYFLLKTDDSISDIAERIGYKSDTHFQNLFKKLVGLTPGQFRSNENNE